MEDVNLWPILVCFPYLVDFASSLLYVIHAILVCFPM